MALTQQLTATRTNSNQTTEAVTATWVSSTPAVATVSSGGLVTAVTVGTTTVTGTSGGLTDTCVVTVVAAD